MPDFGFLDALGLDETSLSRASRVAKKNPGQPEANKDAMPRASRVVPGENNGKVSEKEDLPTCGEGGGQEIKSAAKPDYQAGYAVGFLHCWHMLFDAGVLVHGAQQAGQECNGCRHLVMTVEQPSGGRRMFFWRCGQGYLQLETGQGGERVVIAPTECQAWERWRPKG